MLHLWTTLIEPLSHRNTLSTIDTSLNVLANELDDEKKTKFRFEYLEIILFLFHIFYIILYLLFPYFLIDLYDLDVLVGHRQPVGEIEIKLVF